MIRLSPIVRISLALVMFTTTLLLTADMLGVFPDPIKAVLGARKKVCESLAIYGSLAAQKDDMDSLETAMQVFVHRNQDVLSAALLKADGTVLATAGIHARQQHDSESKSADSTVISVPILKEDVRWGTMEVRFPPLYPKGIMGLWAKPMVKLMTFMVPLSFIAYLLFMRKTLRHLDPSAAIPGRVKTALDTMSEGVVVLDNHERIVMANAAFAEKLDQSSDSLMGRKASELNWTLPNSNAAVEDYPWLTAMREGQPSTGVPLALQNGEKAERIFMVNGAPILDGAGKNKGALATFDDVTNVEKKNSQLQKMLNMLNKSRKRIYRQKQKLEILATQDPLTQCLNRRVFFKSFEAEISRARRHGHSLSCVMTDIDHFKSINDNHGHLTGDEVLKAVSQTLRSLARKSDLVCRYGGEEFCILLPHISADNAVKAADRFRLAIESIDCSGIRVTASFGTSTLEPGIEEPEKMVDRADRALYQAKEGGRNRVVQWGQIDDRPPDKPLKPDSSSVRSNIRGTIINDSVNATPA